jgi:hypothetical protein
MHWLFFVGLIFSSPALALSPEAEEFMALTRELEPLQCEKRKLRRAIAVAEAERRDDDVRVLRRKFADLDKNPETARLEKRLGVLEPRLSKAGDEKDLAAISRQQREAFYRCE